MIEAFTDAAKNPQPGSAKNTQSFQSSHAFAQS